MKFYKHNFLELNKTNIPLGNSYQIIMIYQKSRKEFLKSMNKHFHHILAFKKLNMRSPSNETI